MSTEEKTELRPTSYATEAARKVCDDLGLAGKMPRDTIAHAIDAATDKANAVWISVSRPALADAAENLTALRAALESVNQYAGCGDSSCMFVRPTGMATNGGCRCLGRDGGYKPFLPQALARLVKAAGKVCG